MACPHSLGCALVRSSASSYQSRRAKSGRPDLRGLKKPPRRMLSGRRDVRNGEATEGEKNQWSDMTLRLEALIIDYENGKARNESSASFFDQAVRVHVPSVLSGIVTVLR
jgi:hypothetical protein